MDSSDYIASTSTVIALLALIITIFQLRSARKHNILSVRPLISMHVERDDVLKYSFENKGLGPAIVAQATFIIGDNRLDNPTYEQLQSALSLIKGTDFAIFKYEYHLPVVGAAYKVGEKIDILQFNTIEKERNAELYKILEESVEIQLIYQSLYQDNIFGCSTKEHS